MNNVYTLLLAPRPAGEVRGGGQASASLPLLDDVTASPASRRLASARPALAPKCKRYSLTGPYRLRVNFKPWVADNIRLDGKQVLPRS
jgi:hypothetical protein